jgi:hypothetical protein
MHKAKVSNYVHDPELLVTRGGLHDLLGRGKFDKGRIFHPLRTTVILSPVQIANLAIFDYHKL